MNVCGRSPLAFLCEDYEIQLDNKIPVLKYPSQANLDLSLIASVSTFDDHSVIVFKNGRAFGIGNNINNEIHSSLPNELLTQLTEINILNSQNKPFKIISALCRQFYTLYLLSGDNERDKNKIFCAHKHFDSKFIEIDKNPIALYDSAFINDDGSITLFNYTDKSIIKTYNYFIPHDKAIKLGIGNCILYALGSKGSVYSLFLYNLESQEFNVVPIDEDIIDIDGSGKHCFAVSKKGRVYGIGSYKNCKLGIDDKSYRRYGCHRDKIIRSFIKIDSLRNIKVVSAYAGFYHSIFISNENIAYCIGKNEGRFLLYESSIDETYKPVMIDFKNVTFCIADVCSSVIFIGNCYPAHSPNMKISDTLENVFCDNFKLPSLKDRLIDAKEKEINELKNIVEHLHKKEEICVKRINDLLNEIKKLKE